MIRSLFAWTAGLAVTAVFASWSLLGSLFDASGRRAHACMVRWSRACLALMGVEVEASGLERVRRDGPQVFAANHQSLADILVLAALLPVPFRFVAKVELFRLPFVGWHMRRAGFIPVDRAHPRQAARTLIEAAERIRAGVSAVVFPEGTRGDGGELLPFRGGAFVLAQRAAVPIVPIAISGTSGVLRKGGFRIRPAQARVTVLPPIDPFRWGDDREGLASAVREAIVGALAARPEPAA